MAKDKITENTEKKVRKDHLFKSGKDWTGNANGRPKGSKNFITDFEAAIKGIKDKDTGEQLTMEKIVKIGITKMLKGDAKFEGLYLDLLDRYYGKAIAKQEVELSGGLVTTQAEKSIEEIRKLLDEE